MTKRIRGAGSVSDNVGGQYDCPEMDIELFYLLTLESIGFVSTENEDLEVKETACIVEYSGLEPLTSTLPYILSIKLFRSPLALLSKPKINWLLHTLAR